MKLPRPILVAALALSAGSFALVGCHRDTTVPEDYDDAEPRALADDWRPYGEPLDATLTSAELGDVLADPAAHAGERVQLRGTVSEVCAEKGCWMRLSDPAHPGETLFVKFTCPIDGERLIPADAVGKDAIVAGEVVVEDMSQEEARHMAEDAGKSPAEIEKIVGPQKTIRVMSPSARLRA